MSDIPSLELLHERIERHKQDQEEMQERIASAGAAISDIKAEAIIDRGTLSSTSRHAHRNADTLHGKDGVLGRVKVLEKLAADSAETNRSLRNTGLKIFGSLAVYILWQVVQGLKENGG